ncbi:hypothetical protein ACWEO2_17955 [Nocardia sp. NPDC004278]
MSSRAPDPLPAERALNTQQLGTVSAVPSGFGAPSLSEYADAR